MKTVEQIALKVAQDMGLIANSVYEQFAKEFLAAYLAQQEPVGYVGNHIAHAIQGGSAGLTTITKHMALEIAQEIGESYSCEDGEYVLNPIDFSAKLIEAWQAQQEPAGCAGKHIVSAIQGGSAGWTTITKHKAFDDDVAIYLAPPPAKMSRFEVFSDEDCDTWYEDPADVELLHSVGATRLGDEFEVKAGWNCVNAKYRVTKVPDNEDDDFEVECISRPEENVPPPAIPEWQPIETAPKDGTPVDLFDGDYNTRVCNAKWAHYHWSNGAPVGEKSWGRNTRDGAFCDNPTHWMPLPNPPAQG